MVRGFLPFALLRCIDSGLQSLPKAVIQITIAGAQIFGKAFVAAGRQAYKSATDFSFLLMVWMLIFVLIKMRNIDHKVVL